METLIQDLRYASRTLIKSPGFTLTAILALMIGIGANSAIFSVVNATLLRPLPYEEPDRLMILDETVGLESSDRYGVSYPNFVEWQNQNQSFEHVAAVLYSNVTLTGGDEPSRIPIAFVSSTLFDLLRVKPALGRSFLPEEDKPGASTVVVMSHRLWASGFGADPEIIGKTITLNSKAYSVPGVQSASATSALPISGGDSNGELAIEGRPFAPGEAPGASFRRVLPNYFQTMSIPLLEGRPFDERDRGGDSMVIIINQEMARRYWPSGDALGKRIKIGPPEREPWLTIVAVAGDVKNTGLDAEPKLATYEPHAQRPRGTMDILIRTSVDPMSLADAVRSEIRAADKDAPVYSVGTMEKRIQASVAPRRFNMALLAVFALVALVLAAIGVYGLISYTVTERTREIGIRMALGAQSSDVLKMVIKQGLLLATAGVVSGLVASLFLTRLMTSLLFGVSATDTATFALISTLLIGVALLACAVPAHRATKIDPMVALRCE